MPEVLSITEALSEILAAVSGDNSFPDPDYLAYYKLLKDRIIYLETDVGEPILRLQKQILMWNEEDRDTPVEQRKPIRIIIMSYGGSADYMWLLVDTIKSSKTPVYTYNIGSAHSSAGYIFMAGTKRFMMPNATLVIHQGSAEFDGDAIKVMDATKSYEKMLRRIKEYVVEQTEIPRATLSRKSANDWELTSEDCLKYKVCDKVIESLDELFS